MLLCSALSTIVAAGHVCACSLGKREYIVLHHLCVYCRLRRPRSREMASPGQLESGRR